MPSPNDQCAAAARTAAEHHKEWGKPASFTILILDSDGMLTPRLTAILDPALDPAAGYPAAMEQAVFRYLEEDPDQLPWAFRLCFEGDAAEQPLPGAPAEEHARHWAAVRDGAISSLPGARVIFRSWCVDVHSRGWVATRYQDDPAVIDEQYHQAGTIPATGMLLGLVRLAHATGMLRRLPGPHGGTG